MEEFKFRVKRIFYLKPKNWWSLDGTLEAGLRMAIGDKGTINGDPSLEVVITAMPVVCGADDDLLTICIAQPSFSPDKLVGALIVGVHRTVT